MSTSFAVNDQTEKTEHRNFNHLVFDIAWFGIALAATSSFLSVYAIRVGASPFEQGLLASLPALVLLVSASLSQWWRARYTSARNASFLPGLGMRFMFFLPVFTPFLPIRWQPLWLILSMTLPAIPQGVAGVMFLTMMRETVTDKVMASLLGRRSLALNVAVGVGAVAFGFLLERIAFPYNYQIMFLIAFAFALLSLWHLTRIRDLMPPAPARPPGATGNPWRNANFRSVASITAIIHLAFFAIVPLTSLFLVERLGAGEGYIALYRMLELAAGALVSVFTPRLIGRIGSHGLIAVSMAGTAAAACVIAFSPDLNLALVGAVLSGGSWTAAAGVGLMNYFMERTPKDQMASYSMAFQQAIGLTMFIGPLVGSLLVQWGIDLLWVILLGAGVRMGAAAWIEITLMRARRTRSTDETRSITLN